MFNVILLLKFIFELMYALNQKVKLLATQLLFLLQLVSLF
jgi:hypothetical protein